MGNALDTEAYVGWFSYLSPSPGYVPLVLVSGGVSAGVFALGYVIAETGNVAYLSEPIPYIGAFGIFWTLAWLGWADEVYVDVWNDVRPAFAIAAALYLPGLPLHDPVEEVVLRTGFFPHLHGNRILRVVVAYLFGSVSVLASVTTINGFANHLALIDEVSELPFRDVHTAASELEPVAGFTMASATAWFAGISVIVLLLGTGFSPDVGLALIALFVLAGVVFFLAPQLVLHAALLDAKREVLVGVRKEYEEIRELIGTDPPDDLSLRLDVTDRRLENAKSIRTWAYDVSSAGKLAAASVIPWLNLVEEALTLPLLG